jgi:hypothetical protein
MVISALLKCSSIKFFIKLDITCNIFHFVFGFDWFMHSYYIIIKNTSSMSIRHRSPLSTEHRNLLLLLDCSTSVSVGSIHWCSVFRCHPSSTYGVAIPVGFGLEIVPARASLTGEWMRSDLCVNESFEFNATDTFWLLAWIRRWQKTLARTHSEGNRHLRDGGRATPQELPYFLVKCWFMMNMFPSTYICTKIDLNLHNKFFSNIKTNILQSFWLILLIASMNVSRNKASLNRFHIIDNK